MTKKNLPPPPNLPPDNIKITENYCLIHKGEIKGEIYECPSCKRKYCLECALKIKDEGKKCPKCQQIIFL
ncbi:MAG: hypothetical protein GF353_15300 [Candidatus Lokiarchaeota archaeon]|nr:hypothetical protein [Candidatus Lokiarchaeota archaeon]